MYEAGMTSTSRGTVISRFTPVQTASIRTIQCDMMQNVSDACDIRTVVVRVTMAFILFVGPYLKTQG